MTEEAPPPEPIFTPDQIAEFQEAFEIFDKDGDKKVTMHEMESLIAAIGLSYQGNELEEFCSRIDQTGAGKFDFDEFIKAAEHFRAQINMEEQLLKAFKAFNDDDERMKDDIFFKILQTGGTPFTAEEIRHLKYIIHKDDGPTASADDFIIPNFVKMLLLPKEEPEEA